MRRGDPKGGVFYSSNRGKHPPKGSRLTLGVLGTPCGGTFATAAWLRQSGLNVVHEGVGSDGIVCGFWGLPEWARHGRNLRRVRLSDYEFDHLWLLVRHPFKVSETLWNVFRNQDSPWPGLDQQIKAMRFWVAVMESAPDEAQVIHVDHRYEKDMRAACAELGIDLVGTTTRTSKPHRRPPIDWKFWFEHDSEFAERGKKLVQHFDLEE